MGWRNLPTLRVGWRNLFFQLCCCVSFWFWREIGSFFDVAGNFYYHRKKKIQSSVWRVRDHYYDRKKKVLVICLAGVRSLLRPKKKRYSHLSGGCAIIFTTGKKKIVVVCLAGARSLLRLEKKVLVVCLAGCAVVSVFGSGGK